MIEQNNKLKELNTDLTKDAIQMNEEKLKFKDEIEKLRKGIKDI